MNIRQRVTYCKLLSLVKYEFFIKYHKVKMLNNDFYHYFQYKANKKSSGM